MYRHILVNFVHNLLAFYGKKPRLLIRTSSSSANLHVSVMISLSQHDQYSFIQLTYINGGLTFFYLGVMWVKWRIPNYFFLFCYWNALQRRIFWCSEQCQNWIHKARDFFMYTNYYKWRRCNDFHANSQHSFRFCFYEHTFLPHSITFLAHQ